MQQATRRPCGAYLAIPARALKAARGLQSGLRILKTFFPKILSELGSRFISIEDPSFLWAGENDIVGNMMLKEILDKLDAMGDYDVDSVGSVIKRKSVIPMHEVDFSHGRVDVRELQRKMAIESESDERISSVDSGEQLKEKKKKEEAGSFH